MASNRGSVEMELREPCTDEKARSEPTPIFIEHCPSCWREGQKTEEIQFSKVNEGNRKDEREASIQNIYYICIGTPLPHITSDMGPGGPFHYYTSMRYWMIRRSIGIVLARQFSEVHMWTHHMQIH